MVDVARKVILDCGDNVKLAGYHSPQASAKAAVLLLHGWEGSADSAYMLHCGRYLYRKGFEIFRLNLRDHGESHHLNEGIFHGALTDEVVAAAHNASALAGDKAFFIVGFSLGGNFALRIALSHGETPIRGLRHVVCISPPLDPYKSTCRIDKGLFIYRYYFRKKWVQSLRKKQLSFPHLYDFEEILRLKNTLQMTDILVKQFTRFSGYRDYFNQYTLLGNVFSDLKIPVTAIVSEDDPVISVKDFFELGENPNLELIIHSHGGHCGFLDPFPFGCWYEPQICRIIEQYAG
ncbi:MAG: alpha/beta fold hydrolase [Syntrophaceae bacterium]|nr:alpha/beta fold hydrolase [Syntrophaceae bacterium]